jgi:thymidylate kinase
LWDRYVLSAFAYRIADLIMSGRLADIPDTRLRIARINADFPDPSLTCWLRLPPAIAMTRKSGNSALLDIVDSVYLDLVRELETPSCIVDASSTLDAVLDALEQHIVAHV